MCFINLHLNLYLNGHLTCPRPITALFRPRADHVRASSGASRPGRPGTQPLLEKARAMSWIFLFIAGLLEVVWASAMKQSEGFSRPWPTVVTIVAMIASFALLASAMRALPLGTAYAVWTGIGALGAFAVGIFFLGEAASPLRLLAAGLILSGIVLMKVATP